MIGTFTVACAGSAKDAEAFWDDLLTDAVAWDDGDAERLHR